jgi:leucyl aminopeptidase
LPAQLVLPKEVDHSPIENIVESIYLVRTLINVPTDDMGPSELAAAAAQLAKKYKAMFKQIIGKELLKNNYASIYTVGRGSDDAPRLLDLRWGNKKHPKVTLVGKGVCFDTGGLDIKPASAMLLMKKDMGGAAHVLGLARMIMEAKLPICLRVLIPAVENAVDGNAYRPGDIITSRKGITIEVGNTDAEGRVVLADALTEAVSEKPDLLIDIATLTGAARVALGTELPAVFSNQDKIVEELTIHAKLVQDPIWRLPLFALYRDSLNSSIADINNNASDSYGGAITAGLFLKEFVPDDISWLHFDLMAWNLKTRAGRPQGGEAMALRALFSYLTERFGSLA